MQSQEHNKENATVWCFSVDGQQEKIVQFGAPVLSSHTSAT